MSPFSEGEEARQPVPQDYFPTFVSQNSRNCRGAWRHERRVATGATGELCFTSARELEARNADHPLTGRSRREICGLAAGSRETGR